MASTGVQGSLHTRLLTESFMVCSFHAGVRRPVRTVGSATMPALRAAALPHTARSATCPATHSSSAHEPYALHVAATATCQQHAGPAHTATSTATAQQTAPTLRCRTRLQQTLPQPGRAQQLLTAQKPQHAPPQMLLQAVLGPAQANSQQRALRPQQTTSTPSVLLHTPAQQQTPAPARTLNRRLNASSSCGRNRPHRNVQDAGMLLLVQHHGMPPTIQQLWTLTGTTTLLSPGSTTTTSSNSRRRSRSATLMLGAVNRLTALAHMQQAPQALQPCHPKTSGLSGLQALLTGAHSMAAMHPHRTGTHSQAALDTATCHPAGGPQQIGQSQS